MKKTHEEETTRPSTKATRGSEAHQRDQLAGMADARRLMAKAEAHVDYKTAFSILKEMNAMHERRALRAAANAARPQLTLQETMEKICHFYNLDPKLARPQRQVSQIDGAQTTGPKD